MGRWKHCASWLQPMFVTSSCWLLPRSQPGTSKDEISWPTRPLSSKIGSLKALRELTSPNVLMSCNWFLLWSQSDITNYEIKKAFESLVFLNGSLEALQELTSLNVLDFIQLVSYMKSIRHYQLRNKEGILVPYILKWVVGRNEGANFTQCLKMPTSV